MLSDRFLVAAATADHCHDIRMAALRLGKMMDLLKMMDSVLKTMDLVLKMVDVSRLGAFLPDGSLYGRWYRGLSRGNNP